MPWQQFRGLSGHQRIGNEPRCRDKRQEVGNNRQCKTFLTQTDEQEGAGPEATSSRSTVYLKVMGGRYTKVQDIQQSSVTLIKNNRVRNRKQLGREVQCR